MDAFHAVEPEDHRQGRRLRLGAVLGQAPDLRSPAATRPTCSPWTGRSSPTTRARDVLLDLKPYIDRDGYDLTQLADQAVADFTTPDGQFGLPRDLNVIALFYNKKLFDAAGVAYPDESWDWAKLVEVGKQLTVKDAAGKVSQWGFYTETLDMENYWSSLVWQNGGDIISADHKTNLVGSDQADRRHPVPPGPDVEGPASCPTRPRGRPTAATPSSRARRPWRPTAPGSWRPTQRPASTSGSPRCRRARPARPPRSTRPARSCSRAARTPMPPGRS